MNSETIKTPELAFGAAALMSVISDAQKGVADVQSARLVIGASNAIARAVSVDMQRRMNGFKLAALEAKQIEMAAQETKQIKAAEAAAKNAA